MNILSIINQKGGVGKSTITHALGVGAANRSDKRVLLVDMDAQGNLSHILKANMDNLSLLDVLAEDVPASNAIQRGDTVDFIASHPGLAAADTIFTETGREFRLRESLVPVMDSYDLILLDTSPSFGILAINALVASNSALIPAQTDIFNIRGLLQQMETIDTVRRYCNPSLVVAGILITNYSPRAIVSREMCGLLSETAEKLGVRVLKTKIRESIAIREAQAMQMDIFAYSPESGAVQDYLAVLDELEL